jgi:hypothetical protein
MNAGGVLALISQDKWDKIKAIVTELQDMVTTKLERLDRKCLEQILGSVTYVVHTYPIMKPYLIGLHMAQLGC